MDKGDDSTKDNNKMGIEKTPGEQNDTAQPNNDDLEGIFN
jgi:hypothetical protein